MKVFGLFRRNVCLMVVVAIDIIEAEAAFARTPACIKGFCGQNTLEAAVVKQLNLAQPVLTDDLSCPAWQASAG